MDENNLVLAAQGSLAGIRRLSQTHQPVGARHGTKPRIPEPDPQRGHEQHADRAAHNHRPAPCPRLPHRPLPRIDRDCNALRLGLGPAQRRTHVAEKLHALRAKWLRTNIAFVGHELVGVLETPLRRVGGDELRFRRCGFQCRGPSRCRLGQAEFLTDQLVGEIRRIRPARRADEPHRRLRHLRRDINGVLGATGAVDLHLALGFSNTTSWVSIREKGSRGGMPSVRPSQNSRLPPSLPWLFPGGLPVSEKANSPAAFARVSTC